MQNFKFKRLATMYFSLMAIIISMEKMDPNKEMVHLIDFSKKSYFDEKSKLEKVQTKLDKILALVRDPEQEVKKRDEQAKQQ